MLAALAEAMPELRAKLERERAAKEAEQAEASKPPPPGLGDVIGNAEAVEQIRVALAAHRARCGAAGKGAKPAFPHILFSGSGGTGKTFLSEIIAREVKRPMRLQMGQSLGNPSRVGDVLRSLKAGDVLFIDEMHGLRPAAQEALYRAMEDRVLVPVEKAGKSVSPPMPLPPFTLIGATTDEWQLLPSLLQRFKYRIRLDRLSADDLFGALLQRAGRRDWALEPAAASMIAERAHGTPRLAVGLLDGCMDCTLADGKTGIDVGVVTRTCAVWALRKKEVCRVVHSIPRGCSDPPIAHREFCTPCAPARLLHGRTCANSGQH
jgi:Holliday junction DNA helicase RuvB